MLQLFFVYYGLPIMFGPAFRMENTVAAVLTFTMNYAASVSYTHLYRLDSALYRRCFILRRRCQKISFCKRIVRTEQRIGTIQHGFKLAADAVVIDRGGKHQHSRL